MDVRIDLSYSEHSAFGKALFNLFYFNKPLLEMAPNRSGYPNNGMEHSLRISGEKGDCRAFVELIKDRYPDHSTLEMDMVLQALDSGATNISLKRLMAEQAPQALAG